MGQLLHRSARTTAAVRRAIQQSPESLAKLAKRYDVNPKTVAKWKKRSYVHDAPMGPKPCHATVLTLAEEALIVAFRRHTWLPLADGFYVLQATRPYLTRAALQRCLLRQGISRLPDMAGEKPARKKFKVYPLGSFQSDIAEVRTEEGKLSLCVAIARACKFA
jgi:transposase InsO family protein